MLNEVLRQGFRLTHRHIRLIFLDLLWKSIWLMLTLAGFLLVALWFGSELQSIQWVNTGNRAISAAAALALLREFWAASRAEILGALAMVLVFSVIVWFFLEAAFRSKLHSPPRRGVDARSIRRREATLFRADGVARSASPVGRSLKRSSAKCFAELTTPSAPLQGGFAISYLMSRPPLFCEEGNSSFRTFLLSNILKSLFVSIASLALGAICFGRYFVTPISEWTQLWADTRGAVFIVFVTIAALGFLLTIFDTLVRNDAVVLLGTDLFRVTGLIGILVLFEAMIGGSCAVMLGAGLLNVAGLRSAMAMMATTAVAIGLLNVLHSYLLLVRYSAVDIMRQNVIEV